jgi:dTDP-4-dehydrorhamnose reductase
MKKIFITGGNGQVAYEIARLLQEQHVEFFAPTHAELDITQQSAVSVAIERFRPDAVINAAAYTKVDLAEQDIQQAYAVNQIGAQNIALACATMQCPFLHISTDYIFDGKQDVPYLETDLVKPLNVYGASKWAGEVAVQESYPQAMILRVSGVFGVQGNNFVKTMLRLAREREILRVVADQTICPTPANAIAAAILIMLLNPKPGVYHFCSAEVTNWHAFAEAVVQNAVALNQVLAVKNIAAITTADYPTAAQRPNYSVLDCHKIFQTFVIKQPDWRQGLNDVISQLSAT